MKDHTSDIGQTAEFGPLTSGLEPLVSLTIREIDTGGRLILDINNLFKMTRLNLDSVRRAKNR